VGLVFSVRHSKEGCTEVLGRPGQGEKREEKEMGGRRKGASCLDTQYPCFVFRELLPERVVVSGEEQQRTRKRTRWGIKKVEESATAPI